MNSLLIALVVAVIGPIILSWLNGRQRKAEKILDWARQDDVAAEAKRQQGEVAAQAAEAARLLLAENKKVAHTAAETNEKLDVIHTLVNSNMTAAMQSEYDATVRELAMMREVVALKKAAGEQPSPEAVAAIDATEQKIAQLAAELSDRLKQANIVEAQAIAFVKPEGAN
jgi:replicative DNA helicase